MRELWDEDHRLPFIVVGLVILIILLSLVPGIVVYALGGPLWLAAASAAFFVGRAYERMMS